MKIAGKIGSTASPAAADLEDILPGDTSLFNAVAGGDVVIELNANTVGLVPFMQGGLVSGSVQRLIAVIHKGNLDTLILFDQQGMKKLP